jgi:hypothetical protein
MNIAVTPSLGEFQDDQTRWSNWPDALHRVRLPRAIHVSLHVQHRTPDLKGRLSARTVKHDDRTRRFSDWTRRCAHHPRARRHDWTRSTQWPDATVPTSGRSLERFQRAPITTGHVRSHVTGRATASAQLWDSRCSLGAWPDASVSQGTRRACSTLVLRKHLGTANHACYASSNLIIIHA